MAAAIQLLTVLVLVVVGLLVPEWAPAGTAFGVRVPPERVTAPVVLAWRRAYRTGVLALGLLAATVSAGAAAGRLPVLAVLATVGLALSYYLLYYLAHRAVRAAKAEQNWYADRRQAIAADTSLRTDPVRYPWMWLSPALTVIAITTIYGALRYPDLPDRLVLHYDAAGRPDRYADRTLITAFAPVLAQVLLTVLIAVLAAVALRAPATLDPADPVRAARLYRSFHAVLSRALLLLAADACLGLFFLAQQVWREGGSPGTAAVVAAAVVALGVIGVAATMAYAGGAARRGTPPAEPGAPRARDDDANWRGGFFYVNRDDPALLVPRRFGLGWTLNFGHPMAWLVLAVILAIPVLTSILAART
jgi:uncharacterized membrane protein